MLLEGDRLGGHFRVIAQIRFDCFRRGGAKRGFADLLSREAARQMVIVQAGFADCDHFRMVGQLPKFGRGKSSLSSLAEVGWIPTTAKISGYCSAK